MSKAPGVTSLVPADGMARLSAAMGGQVWVGRHNSSPPPFTGRPMPLADDAAPLAPPLDQLADSAEAPAPDDEPASSPATDTLAAVRGALGAALAALDSLDQYGPWLD